MIIYDVKISGNEQNIYVSSNILSELKNINLSEINIVLENSDEMFTYFINSELYVEGKRCLINDGIYFMVDIIKEITAYEYWKTNPVNNESFYSCDI